MTMLVTLETILLVLLTVLVAGLLRSHAEILRRLESPDQASGVSDPMEDLPPARPESTTAFDIVGTTLTRDPIKVGVKVGSNTLLAFLSSGCTSCQSLWEGLDPRHRPSIPGGARIVVVTKDSAYESPSRLREVVPGDVTLIMSSAAWEAYRVQGSPYFIYVDGRTGTVIGEGTASGWPQVVSLIRDAFADAALDAEAIQPRGSAGKPTRPANRGADRARRAETELLAAGIGPGHPSLYQGGDDPGQGRADG